MTTQIAEEDALTWASNINSEESSPLNSTNSPHCSDDFSAACTFVTTFTPSFHHTECPDENGFLPPILDTGATHCLLPLRWMTNEQASSCKKIHLHVASGSKVRALLHDNIIYCSTVTRPLISVGQMKSMLDLRFVWNDSSPLLLACSGGLKYVLLEATIFHNLPVITSHEMMTLLEAVHTFTATGSLWNAATWSEKLGHKLPLYHWSAPSHPIHLPHDDAAFTDDPQVMFSSMDAVDLLEAAIGDTPPLLSSSSQVVPLQLSSSSSDALPSSSVITFNIADHDPPTEDEQPKKERRAAHENGSSQSQNSLGTMQGKVRRRTRRRRTGQSSFTNSTLSTDVTSGSSTMDIASTIEKSTDHLCSTDCTHSSDFGCHTSSFTIDHESVQSSVRLLLDHRLPKARQRTNVVTPDYVPRGRLFGGYTTRGEGVTIASYRFPQVVSAIHDIASTRPPGFTDEPYLSAQVNASTSLPVHKDKNNHSFTWLIAFGNFSGGRLWIESPIGTHPPPNPRNAVERKLRGDYHDTHNTWICFDPQLYHALEEVTSGNRVSIALFTPKGWNKLTHNCMDELIDIGFYPPHSALSTDAGPTSSTAAASPNSIHTSSRATPTGSVATSTLTLADPLVRDVSSTSLLSSGACMDSSDLATSIFGPLPSEALTFNLPQPDDERTLQEWCSSELVSLPSTALPASDGTVMPLNQREQEELSNTFDQVTLLNQTCAVGAFKQKAQEKFIGQLGTSIGQLTLFTLTLPVPLPLQTMALPTSLVGALRLPGFPLLIDVRLLTSRGSVEVCDALERMVAFFESLQSEGFTITDSSRIKRLHSDRAGEFTAPYFERFLTNHKSIYHTFTSGYDPQANGTAERTVGLVKSLAARALATAQLDSSYWSYSVRYAAQSLLCHALQRHQRSLPFGSSVVAQELDHKNIKFPNSRTVTGRLLFWDHMQDQVSYILVPPGDDNIDFLVYRASIPARLPPAINIDELHWN